MSKEIAVPKKGQVILYQTQDDQTRIEVLLEQETVWLTQGQMAELFQTTVPNVSMHIRNLFQEGELTKDSVVKEFLTTAADGKAYKTNYYNLDVIISVGYRVRSLRGTQFRIWATQRLREFLVKGFILDDERLSEGKTEPRYFDELITRIRAIRASEKNFYRKVQDIYATSIDYDPTQPITHEFFATVQNKMHWAAHGKTAAEVIAQRADASKPNMGLTAWKGKTLTKNDTLIAKNYLSQDELEVLNLLVSQYLDFAELQARAKKPMFMKDWAAKLHDFLKVNDREILKDAGRISRTMAEELVTKEFEKYQSRLSLQDNNPLHPDLEAQLSRRPKLKAPEPSQKEKVSRKTKPKDKKYE